MIHHVMSARRAFASFVVAAVVAALAPSAHAQGAEDGWFDDGSGNPSPAPAPSTPAAPAAPSQPGQPQPLPPSPLLDNQAPQAPVASPEDQDPRALTAWDSYVDPYGTWVDDPRYGHVWVPNSAVVGSDFAPYSTGGHWSLDENDDWVWVSDYPFGWVTFHYGRWVWIGGRGWAWIPGMEYAPAWVTWRVPVGSYGYVGWAPLPPAYVWFGGGPVWFGYAPLYPWVFCPSEYVFSYHVHSYIVHDRVAVAYAARYTRPYAVAAPRAGGYRVAAPHGPTPQAAHIPARSVPMERVSSRAIATRGSVAVTGSLRANYGSRSAATLFNQRSAAVGRSPMMPASRTLGAQRGQPAYRQPGPAAQTYRSSPQAYRPAPAQQYYRPSTPQFAPNRGSVAPRPMTAPHAVRSAPSFGGTRSYGGGSHFGGGAHFGGGGGHFGGGHGHR